MQIVCPHCNAINRVDASRMTDGPRCGQCKMSLFPGKPIELSTDNFNRHITRSELPVLVDFWAPWCAPCRTMAPVIEQVARELSTQVRVAKLDTEANGDLAARFAIRSIPTLALFKDGREITRQAGAVNLPTLLAWLRQALTTA